MPVTLISEKYPSLFMGKGRLRRVLTCVALSGKTWTWGEEPEVVVKGEFYSGKVLICFSCTAHFLTHGAASS